MTIGNFSWVIPDKLAGCALPGGGSDSPAVLASDLDDLAERGVKVLISLEHTPTGFNKLCAQVGIENRAFYIPDFEVPPEYEPLEHLVQQIVRDMHNDKSVCVHCRAGIGRTGLVLACCMGSYFLLSGSKALAAVRAIRAAAETAEQVAFVTIFCKRLHQQDTA